MRDDIGLPGGPVPERTTHLRPYQQAAVDRLRSGEYLPEFMMPRSVDNRYSVGELAAFAETERLRARQQSARRLPYLTDEEADCLAIAIRATYDPGVVAVQTRFHGRDHGRKAERTLAMLQRLADRGLLGPHRRYHATDVDTVSYWFHITAGGRAASVPVVHRIKGTA